MKLQNIKDDQLLTTSQVISAMQTALEETQPFSLVRIGDGENLILAQENILTIAEIEKTKWASLKDNGVDLPCLALRDRMVVSIKNADIVGVLRQHDDVIYAPPKLKRPLTDKIFSHYGLPVKLLCDACVNRYMVSYPEFWQLIHEYRTLLVSKWAKSYAEYIKKQYPNLEPNIVGSISMTHNREMPVVIEKIGEYDFDLALVAAGVNAVVLVPEIADRYRKVAIDFGKAMPYSIRNIRFVKPWDPKKG